MISEVISSLSELNSELETDDQNERARIFIGLCLENNIRTESEIRKVLEALGFNRGHIMSCLDKNCGRNASLKYWHQSEDGQYHLHPGFIT